MVHATVTWIRRVLLCKMWGAIKREQTKKAT